MHKSFFLKLWGLTFVIGGLIYILATMGYFANYLSFVWTSLVFLFLTTVSVYFIMLRAMDMKDHTNFVAAFGASFGLKSLASLAFICYYIFIAPIADKHFVYPFFAMYFAFTGMLVWHLFQMSRQKPLP